jgi:hypothetical protein
MTARVVADALIADKTPQALTYRRRFWPHSGSGMAERYLPTESSKMEITKRYE